MKHLKNIIKMKLLSYLLGCIMLSVVFGGCSGTEVGNPDTPQTYPTNQELKSFKNNQELEGYLKTQYAKNVIPAKAYAGYTALSPTAKDALNHPDVSKSGAHPNGVSLHYSNTNVHEADVDEADVVKTNGEYIYLTKGNGVRVVRAGLPGEEVASLEVEGYADALYLYNDVLVVLYMPTNWEGEPWDDDEDDDDDIDLPDELDDDMDMAFIGLNYRIPVHAKTGVAMFNIADPTNPVLLNAVEVDGYRVSSRRIEGKLHLIQQYLPYLPSIRFWYDEDLEDIQEIIEENKGLISNLKLRDLIPFYRNLLMAADSSGASQAVLPDKFYYPGDGKGGGSITTILTFDLDMPDKQFDSVGIVADAHEVYASAGALYLLSDRWKGMDFDDDDDDIDDDDDLDDDDDDDDLDDDDDDDFKDQFTDIFKFDLTGDTVTVAGSGRVNGWVLNRFSLGEHEDVLRVATTRAEPVNEDKITTVNNVYCLQQNGDLLEVIGSLENIAPGERIYSARFIENRGFLATFKKVDPLITIDLSDPANPLVAGELEVPGYAEYIHPWGDNYLITLGKDVVSDSKDMWVQGLQLSIFDVSILETPVLLHQVAIGDRGTHSEALYNPKAFTFMPEQQLLALPVDLYTVNPPAPEKPWRWGEYDTSGLYAFRVSAENGFEELGVVPTYDDNTHLLLSKWSRGVFMDPNLHAVTPDTVSSAAVEDISNTIQTLNLSK